MKFRWSPATPQPLLAETLATQLKITPLLAQCLVNRGFDEPVAIENFLSPRLKNLADPFLLPNMVAAVERMLLAHECDEPLVIFGDYDVDGVTSTTLLLEVLRKLGWRAEAYLPNRMDEGYGLSRDGVENCLKKFPVKLLLAVDCGIIRFRRPRRKPWRWSIRSFCQKLEIGNWKLEILQSCVRRDLRSSWRTRW